MKIVKWNENAVMGHNNRGNETLMITRDPEDVKKNGELFTNFWAFNDLVIVDAFSLTKTFTRRLGAHRREGLKLRSITSPESG